MNLHAIQTGDHAVLLDFMRAKFPTWTWWEEAGQAYYKTTPAGNTVLLNNFNTRDYSDRARRWDAAGRNNIYRY